ncbi:MAG: helix-turn-helix transcriptional regulator [Oscillospiraceae bacterium]|nr:helix-turn-helix transcriptional regulator [Oscillospiraceae bacterium]
MLKDYLAERKISMYSLAANSGVPYSTVNDLANGRIEIQNCRAGVLKKIADELSISMDALYDLCESNLSVYLEEEKIPVAIRVKNKTYYAEFYDNNIPVSLEICAVNRDTAYFIHSLAKWTVEDYFEQKEWEAANALLAHAKG